MFDDNSFDTNSFSTSSWLMQAVQVWRGQVVKLRSIMTPLVSLISKLR